MSFKPVLSRYIGLPCQYNSTGVSFVPIYDQGMKNEPIRSPISKEMESNLAVRIKRNVNVCAFQFWPSSAAEITALLPQRAFTFGNVNIANLKILVTLCHGTG
jgi:hypothetical protein